MGALNECDLAQAQFDEGQGAADCRATLINLYRLDAPGTEPMAETKNHWFAVRTKHWNLGTLNEIFTFPVSVVILSPCLT